MPASWTAHKVQVPPPDCSSLVIIQFTIQMLEDVHHILLGKCRDHKKRMTVGLLVSAALQASGIFVLTCILHPFFPDFNKLFSSLMWRCYKFDTVSKLRQEFGVSSYCV